MDQIIIKPVITEKSLREAALGRYTFLVAEKANKTAIKNAIAGMFKVDPVSISTNLVRKTKNIRTKKAMTTHEFSYKKARITLKKNQKIDIFEELVSK